MKILFIGDIVGRPGRRILAAALPELIVQHECSFVIANGENAAAGFGLSRKVAQQIFEAGVDVITTGNHVWADKEIFPLLEETERILRPANFPPNNPGRGSGLFETRDGHRIGVINLIGRIFMEPAESPFVRGDEEIAQLTEAGAEAIVIDFHAEATSEKQALAYYFDGRVTAVIGTHTHVMTCDEQILPGGTAYITDCGMTGPSESVIGIEKEIAVRRFLTGLPERFEVPRRGPAALSAVLIETALDNKAACSIVRIQKTLASNDHEANQEATDSAEARGR